MAEESYVKMAKKYSCVWAETKNQGIYDCMLDHENYHSSKINCPPCGISRGGVPVEDANYEELFAYRRTVICLRGKLKTYCNTLPTKAEKSACKADISRLMDVYGDEIVKIKNRINEIDEN